MTVHDLSMFDNDDANGNDKDDDAGSSSITAVVSMVDRAPPAFQLLLKGSHQLPAHDLFWAARHFLDRAKGFFGLALVSELDQGCLVLGALKQPMTITMLPHAG